MSDIIDARCNQEVHYCYSVFLRRVVISVGTNVVEAYCLHHQGESETYTEDGRTTLSETLGATEKTTRRHGTGRQYHKHSVCVENLLKHKQSLRTKH